MGRNDVRASEEAECAMCPSGERRRVVPDRADSGHDLSRRKRQILAVAGQSPWIEFQGCLDN